MRLTRLHLAIVLTALGGLGAFWAVSAQEIFLPPPVLQPDAPPAKPPEKNVPASAKLPLPSQPGRDKSKADPTLIIPPEVYDLPHVVQTPPLEGKPGLLLTEGVAPPPLFPPAPAVVQPIAPPGPPALEPRPMVVPVVPAPPPEPTKMLIEPLAKDPPAPAVLRLPADAAPPPSLVFPQPVGNAPAPTFEKVKAFVRLRSAANEIAPPSVEITPIPPQAVVGLGPLAPPAGLMPAHTNALVNLQTPAIGMEKRGPATLRAGETQTYQIVVRNLGAVPAQQVRIEEEIPPGARLVSAEPQPQWQGTRASWILSALAPGSEQVVRLTLQADVALQLGATTSVHVSTLQAVNAAAVQPIRTVALTQPNPAIPLAVRLSGPERASVGKPVEFDIHVTNQSGLPLTGVVLFGYLPEGLSTQAGREIEGAVAGMIAPGGFKLLKMPANAVKPGRYTVRVKLVSNAGEAEATALIEIAADALTVQQAELTRLYLGRDGDLRIEVANGTGRQLRNVQVASVLPEGLDFLGASDRGMYQANHRTVFWLIDAMAPGQTQTLSVRIAGARPGQYQNFVFARADGIAEIRSTGAIALEGMANLKLRVIDRDNPLELGKDTVYEIQVSNSGGAAAHNVRLQVQLPPGLMPRNAEGKTRHAVDRQTVTFEPIPSLAPDGQAVIYRVSAHAQAAGDQRVQFMIFSDEVQTPLVREVSTKVY